MQLPDKKYNILYIDPPWIFNNKNTGGTMKSGAENKYKVMSLDELKKMDINSICEDDCVLFMWWVGSQPQEALDLVNTWGFKLKTMTGFNWVKLTKLNKLHFGMGFWTRAGSECCLIATKGKPKPIKRNIRSVVKAYAGEHSKKPNIIADKIVELCGDLPRLEIFARDRKHGWDSWGLEVPEE